MTSAPPPVVTNLTQPETVPPNTGTSQGRAKRPQPVPPATRVSMLSEFHESESFDHRQWNLIPDFPQPRLIPPKFDHQTLGPSSNSLYPKTMKEILSEEVFYPPTVDVPKIVVPQINQLHVAYFTQSCTFREIGRMAAHLSPHMASLHVMKYLKTAAPITWNTQGNDL